MKKRIWMLLLSMSLIMGNGLTASAAPQMPNDNVAIKEEETAQAPAILDGNIYGNAMGNIINGGLFLEDDTYYYLYHGYKNCVYKTDKQTGISVRLGSAPLHNLNMINGKLYGNVKTQTGGSIIEIDLNSGMEKSIRHGNVDRLLAVNQELYFIDMTDMSLRKLNLTTMQETILASQSVYSMTVYKDRIYFTIEQDGDSLYSMSKDGGELRKLNNVTSYMPTIYQDRIYYLALEGNAYSIRSMGLDGSGEMVLCNMDVLYMNLYCDKLFFVNNNARNELYYIDLSSASPVPVRFDLHASLEAAVKEYAIVPPTIYQVIEYRALNFGQTHMLFMCDEIIDGEKFDDAYLYDFATGEVMPIAYFCADAEELARVLAAYR